MPLTKEQLLIPRVMCVGTEPGKLIWPWSTLVSGQILTPTHNGVNYAYSFTDLLTGEELWLDENGIAKFPNLFRPMPWWEGRNPEDMPKWVKFSENYMNFKAGSVYETECWSDKHYDCIQFRSEEGLCGVPFGKWVAPATEQEYLDYQKQKEGLGVCKEKGCERFATRDYNGHGYYVCEQHYESLSNYFDEEYK